MLGIKRNKKNEGFQKVKLDMLDGCGDRDEETALDERSRELHSTAPLFNFFGET